MKIVHELKDSDFIKGDQIITNRIALHTTDANMILSKGFQCWVDIENFSKGTLNYFLRYSEGKGGSFAEAKMKTLKAFPARAITGNVNFKEFMAMIHAIRPDYQLSDNCLFNFESTSELPKSVHADIRDKVGITAFLGGLRVPFITSKEEEGEVRITFSGASPEQDLLLATMIFEGVQVALDQSDESCWYKFDLSELKKIPIMGYNLMLLNSRPLLTK